VFKTVIVEGTTRPSSRSITHLRLHRRWTVECRRTAEAELTDWCDTADLITLRAELRYNMKHLSDG
jgi:hypothetical protein